MTINVGDVVCTTCIIRGGFTGTHHPVNAVGIVEAILDESALVTFEDAEGLDEIPCGALQVL